MSRQAFSEEERSWQWDNKDRLTNKCSKTCNPKNTLNSKNYRKDKALEHEAHTRVTYLTNDVKYAGKLSGFRCRWDGKMTSHSPMRTEESSGAWVSERGGMVTSRKDRKCIDSSSAGRAGIFYCSSWRMVCWLPVPLPAGVENTWHNTGHRSILL